MANAWKLKHRIFDAVGPQPLAIRLVDGDIISDDEFVIFAKRIEPPRIRLPGKAGGCENDAS